MPGDVKYLLLLLLTLVGGATWSYWQKADTSSRWKSRDAQISTIRTFIEENNAYKNDIVFLGASSTMNGIDAPELNRLLAPKATSCLNLGINWFGHEMQLSILEAWLEQHHPKKIVVEVPMIYRYYMHPHLVFHQSPLVMKSLWSIAPHRALVPSLCQGPRYILQNCWPESSFADPQYQRLERSGTLIVAQNEFEVQQSLIGAHKILSQPRQQLAKTTDLKNVYRHFRYHPQLGFLKAIRGLCKNKGVPLVFLAMPSCGFQTIEPELLEVYQTLAPLWEPPWELLQKPPYWRDSGHLNATGARELAQWLAQKIETAP